MFFFRVLPKLLRALVHIVGGWWTIRFDFPRMSQHERDRRVERWARELLQLIGIELVVGGVPPQAGPMLLVVNHISWLDIVAIHAAKHVRFVGKSNIARWPLVGTLATGGGTLYIERERPRDAVRVIDAMAEALGQGDLLAIFPEGTTTDGTDLLPFHANLLQAAIAAQAPVQPVGIAYADADSGAPSTAAVYVGDDSLVGSLWRTLSAPPLRLVLNFGDPQTPSGRSRRRWSEDLHAAVQMQRMEASRHASVDRDSP